MAWLVCARLPHHYLVAVLSFILLLLSVGYRACFALMATHISSLADSGINRTTVSPNSSQFPNCPAPTTRVDWTGSTVSLFNAAYFAGQFVMSIPAGAIVMNRSPKRVFGLTVLGTSVCQVLLPVASRTHVGVTYFIRTLQGVFEAANFPALNAVISIWAPAHQKARLMNICYSGAYLSPAVAMFVSGATSCYVSWDSHMYIYGVVGIFWCLPWMVVIQASPDSLETSKMSGLESHLSVETSNRPGQESQLSVETSNKPEQESQLSMETSNKPVQESKTSNKPGQESKISNKPGQESETLNKLGQESETSNKPEQESETLNKPGQKLQPSIETSNKLGQESETLNKPGQESETSNKPGQELKSPMEPIHRSQVLIKPVNISLQEPTQHQTSESDLKVSTNEPELKVFIIEPELKVSNIEHDLEVLMIESDLKACIIEPDDSISGSIKTDHVPWGKIFTSLPMLAIWVGAFSRSFMFGLLLTEMQQYYKDVYDVPASINGLLSGVPQIFMTVFMLAGAWVFDTLIKKNILSVTNTRKLAQCLGFGVQGACTLAVGFVEDYVRACVLLCVGAAFSGFAISGYQTNVLDIAPQYTGPLTGIYRTGMLGSVLSTTLTSVLTGTSGSLVGWQHVFIIAGSIHLGGVVFYAFFASGDLQPWAQPRNTSKCHSPVLEPAPVLEPSPVSEPAPVLEPSPVLEPAPVLELASVSEPAPVLELAPVTATTQVSQITLL